MAIGIFNKLKKSFKAIGSRIGGFAKKALQAMPQIASVGKQVVNAVSPILSTAIPGSGLVLNGINRGLDYVGKFSNTFGKHNTANNKIGRSLISEID